MRFPIEIQTCFAQLLVKDILQIPYTMRFVISVQRVGQIMWMCCYTYGTSCAFTFSTCSTYPLEAERQLRAFFLFAYSALLLFLLAHAKRELIFSISHFFSVCSSCILDASRNHIRITVKVALTRVHCHFSSAWFFFVYLTTIS
jgi:hypothetical protein